MAENQYIYAVARIRSKELTLLSNQFLEQLIASKNHEESLRLLQDKGWGSSESKTVEEILTVEREKTWDLINELVEDASAFDVFLYSNDYHNLKAAIKLAYVNNQVPDIYLTHGTIEPELIYQSVKEHDFSKLPERMRKCAEEAYQVLFHTGDGQLCDIIIDKAALEAIYKTGKSAKNEVLAGFVELKVVAADINIAIRGYKTKKGKDFLERAFASCDSLDIKKLTEATLSGEEAIYEYLENTVYAQAVKEIKKSPSAFERWCDNVIIEHIKPQKYNPFTVSPLAAYILARENEIKTVRILLSGKLNNLPEDSIRERLREMYV